MLQCGILWQLLDRISGDYPERSCFVAIDEMEVQTVLHVQAALRTVGRELTYGEAFSLWTLVNLDCQSTWVDTDSPDGAAIEIQRLCEHVRDGCDYAGISRQ